MPVRYVAPSRTTPWPRATRPWPSGCKGHGWAARPLLALRHLPCAKLEVANECLSDLCDRLINGSGCHRRWQEHQPPHPQIGIATRRVNVNHATRGDADFQCAKL